MDNKLKECYDIVHNAVRSLLYNDETNMYEFTEEQYLNLLQVECNLEELLDEQK